MQVGNEGEGNIDALYGFGDLDELDKKIEKISVKLFPSLHH
jgi:hypothetical protein